MIIGSDGEGNCRMPLSFVIDKQRKLVVSTASGLVTYSEIAAHQVQLKNDPDFDPTFDQLVDATGVTKISVKVEEIQTVARQRLFAAGSRQAFATSSDFVYGMARMFEIYREASGSGRPVRVFSSLDAAQEWLQPVKQQKKA
jgi:hypothetical protein